MSDFRPLGFNVAILSLLVTSMTASGDTDVSGGADDVIIVSEVVGDVKEGVYFQDSIFVENSQNK